MPVNASQTSESMITALYMVALLIVVQSVIKQSVQGRPTNTLVRVRDLSVYPGASRMGFPMRFIGFPFRLEARQAVAR